MSSTSKKKVYQENVRMLKSSMKAIKMEEITPIHQRYDVENSEKSRTSYNCHIALPPSFSCSDYALHGSHVLCKHILFDVSFTQHVVENQLAKTFEEQFVRERKSIPRLKKSSSEILKSHKNFNEKQIVAYHLKGR